MTRTQTYSYGSLLLSGSARLGVLVALLAAVSALTCGALAAAAQQSPADQLAQLATHVDAASAALSAGDPATAQLEYTAFDDGWFDVEDGVREQSRAAYRAIEQAMGQVQITLAGEPIDVDAALAALVDLRRQCDLFITGELAPG